jgi:hypothetical protein
VGLAVGLGLELGEPEQQPPDPLQSDAMVEEIASAIAATTRARILIMAPVQWTYSRRDVNQAAGVSRRSIRAGNSARPRIV